MIADKIFIKIILKLFSKRCFYVGSADTLPPPLEAGEEERIIHLLPDDKAKNMAGYEVSPKLGNDGNPQEPLPQSAASKCQETQNSSRCQIEANGAVVSDNVQQLLRLLRSKAASVRSKSIRNFDTIVQIVDVNEDDTSLVMPASVPAQLKDESNE